MIKRDVKILFYIKYLSRLGSSTRLETVLESSGDVLQVSHSTGTGSVSSLGLLTPVVRSSLSSWVTTASTGLLLNVEGTTTTSVTQSVGLVVTLTERWSTLCTILVIINFCHRFLNQKEPFDKGLFNRLNRNVYFIVILTHGYAIQKPLIIRKDK